MWLSDVTQILPDQRLSFGSRFASRPAGGHARAELSTDEIMALTRGRAAIERV